MINSRLISPNTKSFVHFNQDSAPATAQLLHLLVYIYVHIRVSIIALLDLSNAFNTVDCDILLAVLKSINVSASALDWF